MLARAVLGQSFAVEMLRSAGVVLAFSVCFTTPARVRADTASDPSPARIRQAAEAFDLGRDAYQREDFVEAAEQFERADSQAPSATAIEYAMRAREKAGQLDRAATLAALALDRHAGDPNLEKLAKELLNRAKPTLFSLTVHCEEPCELAIERTIVHGAPSFSRVVFLKDGAALVHAGFQNGTSATRSITASPGEKGDLSFSLPALSPTPSSAASPMATPGGLAGPAQGPGASPAAGPPTRGAGPLLNGSSPEERPSHGLPPAVFWVGVGLTVAAGGVATWSGLDTLNDPGEARIHSECARGDTSCEAYRLGIAKQRRTNILLGVTGGLGLGTILIGTLFTDWRGGASRAGVGHALPPRHTGGSSARSTAPAWEPWFALGEGALAGARGRF